MPSDLEQKYKDLYRVRQTLIELLVDRGVDINTINSGIGYADWCKLVDEYINGLPSLDMQVGTGTGTGDGKRVYVRYIEKFKAGELRTAYKVLMRMMDANRDKDDIIIIYTGNMTQTIKSDIAGLENSVTNLTIFHYQELLFNVSRHILVPRHSIIQKTEEKEQIMRDYQITSDLQFPVISRDDPQSRYLGVRKGQLVKIERPSIGGMCHTVYRIVI